MKPAPLLQARHLVSHKHCGDQRHDHQHYKNDQRRVKLHRGGPRVGDVNHRVEGGDQLHSRKSIRRFSYPGGRLSPDFRLKILRVLVLRNDRLHVRDQAIRSNT